MNKKSILEIIILLIIVLLFFLFVKKDSADEVSKLEAVVLSNNNEYITIQDKNNLIYVVNYNDKDITAGNSIILEYSGLLDSNKSIQSIEVLNYEKIKVVDNLDIFSEYDDNGIFSTYYKMAYDKLNTLSLNEKIGQLLLVRYNEDSAVEDIKKYNLGGLVFFEKDFKDKTKEEVISMIKKLQENSKIPLLTAVDEEGGKVVRISNNSNLREEPFKSSSSLYKEGGFDLIKKDTKDKSDLLNSLGINVNLAPVVDVSTNFSDYIYERTLGENTNIVSHYAKTVIEASKGLNVSYVLKHFPGYGSNSDTHLGTSIDSKTYDDILNIDIPPFEAGIKAGAEAILVSHNIVSSIDSENPASLSVAVHNLLRDKLNFTGIIITDDIAMSALENIENTTVSALLAGNDLIITTDYVSSINEIKSALQKGIISENLINKIVFRNLAWKYYKELMFDSK